MKTFYITTPIYYANSLPHLGHLYTTTVSDVVNRYKKQRGFETYFLTGTDEHGINIQRAAEENKRTPQQQVDYVADELKKMFADFGLDTASGGYDIFMRTTNDFHYKGVQKFWEQMASNTTPKGNSTIYKDFYKAWFCAACAEFKTETEYEIRDGEEIPRCLVHEKPLDRVEEESYFFRLSDYEEILLEKIEQNENLIRPESRKNEIVSFIKGGLQDLSISREKKAVSWGVPVPGDENHVMYVWVDALSNYITALGWESDNQEKFEKYWKSSHHFIGKDILRFHTVYWFSFLLAAEIELPQTVYGHGMWVDGDGRKMGKTLGNIIEPNVLHEYFQTDALRYFLLREMVFGKDGRFSYENLLERTNADLAKGLGNLSSRTLSMVDKYRESIIPDGTIHDENTEVIAEKLGIRFPDANRIGVFERARDAFIDHFDKFEFDKALSWSWTIVAETDRFITRNKPWALVKGEGYNSEALNAVLYTALESLRWLCVMLHPVMPESTQAIYTQMGLDGSLSEIDPAALKWGELKAGEKIGEAKPVFPRLEPSKIMTAIEEASEKEDVKEESFIEFDDFIKVELKVGEVLECEAVPKSEKLLKCAVDLGEDNPRQILAGMAKHYSPKEMVGKKIVVVANLKPRKMMGLESQGMICAASIGDEDKPVLATFLENVPNGARLK